MMGEETHYYVACDMCKCRFYDKYGEDMFDSEEDAEYRAEKKGWLIMENGKHFCSNVCKDQYMANLFLKGGEA